MTRVDESAKIDNVQDIEEVKRKLTIFAVQVVNAINGNLTFADNMNCKIMDVQFNSANVDTAVVHNLGRVPIGYIPIKQSVALSVYDGTDVDNDKFKRIFLKSSAIGSVRLILF